VVKEQKAKQPRIRKPETVRERTAKSVAKAESRAAKHPKKRVRKAASVVAKPFKKPVRFITSPLRTRPARAIGRFFSKIFVPTYFRNSFKEVKLVTWPTRRETWRLAFAVLAFAVVFGLAAAGTDIVLDKIIRRIVFRA